MSSAMPQALSNVARPGDFHRKTTYLSERVEATPRRSVFRWLYDAVMWSRERQADRDIGRVVSWRDGGFNDSFEREIAERYYSGEQGFRR